MNDLRERIETAPRGYELAVSASVEVHPVLL
jgi:hypothetical protein